MDYSAYSRISDKKGGLSGRLLPYAQSALCIRYFNTDFSQQSGFS